MNNLIKEKVFKFLEKYNFLKSSKTIIIAFSGGYDSLCLLDVLYREFNDYINLVAAHLNHNWRGKESKQEELNANIYCLDRNIAFYSEVLPENLPQTELKAREQRYKFFNNAAQKYNADAIFTGHTFTDNVETILYRIIKGTGLKGLQGIPEVRYQESECHIYRPILDLTREDTINYCNINNLKPNVDSSNLEQKYLRNKIRLSLLPELKYYNSNIDNALYHLSQIALDSEGIIEEYLQEIKNKVFLSIEELSIQKFIQQSIGVKRRLLMEFLLNNDLDYSFEKVNELLDFIKVSFKLKSGNTLSLTKGKWLFVSSEYIKIINYTKSCMVQSSIVVDINRKNYHPELGITLEFISRDKENLQYLVLNEKGFPDEKSSVIYADLSNVKGSLYIRTRRHGDKIQPFGMNSRIKLKKYLINKGVPEHERDRISLLTTDDQVLWVVGVGISEVLRVKDNSGYIIKVS